MLLHGDEIGRSQRGNNNAYCQDNEFTWMSWDWSAEQRALLDWTKRLVRLRREYPVLRSRRFLSGEVIPGTGIKDISWLKPDGSEVADADWEDDHVRALQMWLAGVVIEGEGRTARSETLVVLLNAWEDAVEFRLPRAPAPPRWSLVLDTGRPLASGERLASRSRLTLGGRSIAILKHPAPA